MVDVGQKVILWAQATIQNNDVISTALSAQLFEETPAAGAVGQVLHTPSLAPNGEFPIFSTTEVSPAPGTYTYSLRISGSAWRTATAPQIVAMVVSA